VKRDRLGLVVIAERPVAEHLEKGVMVGVAADRFEVVVLARDSEALLAVHHAHRLRRADSEEVILERHHPGVGEQQRRVAHGH